MKKYTTIGVKKELKEEMDKVMERLDLNMPYSKFIKFMLDKLMEERKKYLEEIKISLGKCINDILNKNENNNVKN